MNTDDGEPRRTRRNEDHEEEHRHHDEDAWSGMRQASPLSSDTERVMRRTIGAAIAVHRRLGPGFLESIYRRALRIELSLCGLAFEQEHPVTVRYRGIEIGGQRIDLIVENQVIVELKAVSALDDVHRAQLISYLRTTGLRGGLLMNFRVLRLRDGLRRIVL